MSFTKKACKEALKAVVGTDVEQESKGRVLCDPYKMWEPSAEEPVN